MMRLYQETKGILKNVAISEGWCLMAMYFRNHRQFCFLIEKNKKTYNPFVEYNLDLGKPSVIGGSDGGGKVEFIGTKHSESSFKQRIQQLEVGSHYQKLFLTTETEEKIEQFMAEVNNQLQGVCLYDEVYGIVKSAAKNVEIDFPSDEQSKCILM